MTWTPELDELARRSAMALQMGGADKVQRQHDGGRLTVRERITQLLDAGSFHEVGALSGIGEYDAAGTVQAVTPANCAFGRGRVDGRPVVVVGGPRWRCGLDGAGRLAAAAAAGEIVRAINATPTHPLRRLFMRRSNPLTWASGTTLATLAATAAAALTRDRDIGTLGRPGRNAGVLDAGKRGQKFVRR